MAYITVDRFEGDIALLELEDGSMIKMAVADLPNGAKEGSVLGFDDNGNLTVDRDEEKRRRSHNKQLQDRLFK